MAKPKLSEKVPQKMTETFANIAKLSDQFSQHHLNDEYAQVIRYAIAALCRKRPSPLLKGRSKTWACGITHAIGMVNFLYDSTQDPHIRASDLYKEFGVSASTGQAKSKLVRDTLNMSQLDSHWMLPSRIDSNPAVWMISFDGFIVDARSLPFHIQAIAYEKGLIPYIPEINEQSIALINDIEPKTKAGSEIALYTLEVFIIGGPISEEFVEQNPVVSRTIEIQGKHTLHDLHEILYQAFDREEEHMYEFQVGGHGPHDPQAQRYGLTRYDLEDDEIKNVETSTLASLGLSIGESFGYWFDFGDSWWHQIQVTAIDEQNSRSQRPRITERVGDSPPQNEEFD